LETSAKITKSLRKEDAEHKWWVMDATGLTVGRLASQAAVLLRGKHKPNFTPHVDNGDYVIIVNADKVVFQGKRAEQKEYKHHTMYPGGQITRKYKDLINTKPEFIIQHAINGMLPKTKLGSKIKLKLKVYVGDKHEHQAQKPEIFNLNYRAN
jgi:large subunit ribosomal protein L13